MRRVIGARVREDDVFATVPLDAAVAGDGARAGEQDDLEQQHRFGWVATGGEGFMQLRLTTNDPRRVVLQPRPIHKILSGRRWFLAAAFIGTLLGGHSYGGATEVVVPALDVSKVSLVFVRFVEDGAGAEMELRNADQRSFNFAGYGPSSPAYAKQCRAGETWTEEDSGWCGTGMETQQLDPGDTRRFTASLCLGQQPSKIGVSLRELGTRSRNTLWSEEILAETKR